MTEQWTDSGDSEDATAGRREQVALAIRALRAGQDPEANFRIVFESYHRPLLRFFARKGFCPSDALDLTQETFFGIFRSMKGLREETLFEAWLYKVATTTYLRRVRAGSTAKRAGLEVGHDETVLADPSCGSSGHQLQGVLEGEKRRAMRKAIAELPDQMRKCMTLRIYHELAYREIATTMRIKIDTVKAHLSQGRARLKAKLERYSPGGVEEVAE